MNRKYLSWVFALLLGVLGTVQYHLTQFSSGFDTFFGDRGDVRGVVALCEHWYQALIGHAELLSPGFFYPVRGVLGSSEFMLGFGIPYSVLRITGLGMFASLETVVIVLTFLTYLACFVLLYNVLRFHLLAACVGAMFFAFSSPKFFQLIHLQLQFVICLPVIFAVIILLVQQAATITQTRAFVLLSLAGLAFNLQLLTAFYLAWFFSLWCFLFLLLALLLRRSREFIFALVGQFRPALLASAVTFVVGATPFMFIYLPRAKRSNWYTYANVKLMIPDSWAFLSMGNGNYVWGWLAQVVRPRQMPDVWGELTIGVGLVTTIVWIGITVLGIWIVVKNFQSPSPLMEPKQGFADTSQISLLFVGLMILATTLFYCLGFQYGDGHSLWKLVYNLFPGAKAIRAMSRYVIFLTLPMAIAMAFVLDYGIKRIQAEKTAHRRTALTIVLVSLASFVVVEQLGVPRVVGTGFSRKAENAYLTAMADKLPNDCTAFYVAASPDDHHSAPEYQYDAMLIATMKQIPTLNGSTSQFPPNWFGLYQVKDVGYEENVRKWIELNGLQGKICRLQLSPPVEAFAYISPQ